MENCKRHAELMDWVLGELPADEAGDLAQHVAQCPECERAAEPLRRLQQALANSLTDREMPARLVFAPQLSRALWAGFWTSLARTAALSAAAAGIFLAILSAGLGPLSARWFPAGTRQAALPQSELRTLISQAVAAQGASERKQNGLALEQLADSLRQEQATSLARVAQQLGYVESAQNTVWKQMQQQNEVVSLIARDYLQPAGPSLSPARR